MSFIDPYRIPVPEGSTEIGTAPFWGAVDAVTWTYRRFNYEHDPVEVRRPMTVIEDGPRGAVLWMPGGTPTTDTRVEGWEETNPHDVPLRVRFCPPDQAPRRIMTAGRWHGRGVLKIVPASVPFSVWVLLKDDHHGAAGPISTQWYVNLETTHRRRNSTLYTSDQILDIIFSQGRIDEFSAVFKDVDELAAAANWGAWPARWSQLIRANGSHLLNHLGDYAWVFDPIWETVARHRVCEGGYCGVG